MIHSASGKTVRKAAQTAALFFVAAAAHAGFQQASPSVTADGMAGNFAAKADDSSALFVNPAGLSQLPQSEASFMYAQPLAGMKGVSISQSYLAAAVPLSERLTLGMGGTMFDANGLLREYQGVVGAAFQAMPEVSVGVNLTYLTHSYNVSSDPLAASDPVFATGRSKGAVGFDVGALGKAAENVSLGVSVRNLNRPDVGLASKDPVPMEVRGGAMYRRDKLDLLADVKLRDAGSDVSEGRQVLFGAGAQWRPLPDVALRAGFNTRQFAVGAGLTRGSVRVDYAFSIFNKLMSDSFGTHKLALTFKFGALRSARGREAARTVETEPDRELGDEIVYTDFLRAGL